MLLAHLVLPSLLPLIQVSKGKQKTLLATPAEGTPYGVTFIPGPGPPGTVAPVLSYMQPVEGMPALAMAVDPTMMMGNLDELGHFQGGLFIPHLPPEGQRMMMPVPGDSPQHVAASLPYHPKQRSRAIPIVAPQVTPKVCSMPHEHAICCVCVCVCVCVGVCGVCVHVCMGTCAHAHMAM